MIEKFQIFEIVERYVEDKSLFLLDIRMKPGNKIIVIVDGDQGVTVEDCIQLHRHIESQLDRNVEDYDLTVSSAGMEMPLSKRRQFQKNVGRKMKLVFEDGKNIEGQLKAMSEDGIEFEYSEFEGEKKIKKKVTKLSNFGWNEFKEAYVIPSFN